MQDIYSIGSYVNDNHSIKNKSLSFEHMSVMLVSSGTLYWWFMGGGMDCVIKVMQDMQYIHAHGFKDITYTAYNQI